MPLAVPPIVQGKPLKPLRKGTPRDAPPPTTVPSSPGNGTSPPTTTVPPPPTTTPSAPPTGTTTPTLPNPTPTAPPVTTPSTPTTGTNPPSAPNSPPGGPSAGDQRPTTPQPQKPQTGPVYQETIVPGADALGPAGDLADQYDTWLKEQQRKNTGNYQTSVDLANAANDLNNRALSESIENQRGLLDEGRYRNALDQNSNVATGQMYARDKDLMAMQYGADMDWIAKTWGITDQQYAADVKNLNAMKSQIRGEGQFAQRQYGISEAGTNLQETVNYQGAESDASTRGAMLSQGFGDSVSAIGEQARIGHSSNQLALDRAMAQMRGDLRNADYQIGTRGRQHEGDINNLTHQKASTTISYDRNLNSLNNAMTQNGYAMQALQSIAREYGIRDKDLVQTLANKTAMNNLDATQIINGLTQAYEKNDAELIQQYNQFLAYLMGAQ